MTEEIKEISDLQRCADNNKSHLLLDFEIKNILRYITNLQKENEELKENNKRKTSRCTERNHRIRVRDRIIERRNKKINKLEDYKQRNEKAVEYIKQHCEIIHYQNENIDKIGKVEGIPLLNILEGGDE